MEVSICAGKYSNNEKASNFNYSNKKTQGFIHKENKNSKNDRLAWNNPHAGFCWFGHSFSRVVPVVFSHTQESGHFIGWTKKKRRWKKENRQTRIQNCKTQDGKVWLFKYSCMCYVCLWLSQELSENPKQQPKMLTHLVIIFTALCLRSWLYTAFCLLWTHVLELTDQPHVLSLNWLSFLESHS